MYEVPSFQYTTDQSQKIKQLRNLIEADTSLEIGTEDVFLSKFLYFRRWHVGDAYESIHKYYDFKISHANWLAQGALSKYENILFHTHSRFVLPKADRDGRVVIVLKVVDATDRFPNYLEDIIQLDDFIIESMLLTKQAQKYGLTIVFDLVHATKNTKRVVLPAIAQVLSEKQTIMPWTACCIHYIQKRFTANNAFSQLKKRLVKESKKQIFYHDVNNLQEFHDLLGYECVPAIYGGPAENLLLNNLLYNHLKRNEHYLTEIQKYQKKVMEEIN